MITEQFLNSCFSLVLSKNDKIKTKKLLSDILYIINFYSTRKTIEVPLVVRNKTECLKKICELSVSNDKNIDNVLDSILASEKYKSLGEFLITKTEETTSSQFFSDNLEQVKLRKKLVYLLSNYDQVRNLLDTIRDGKFESTDDLVSNYEIIIKQLYNNVAEQNRQQNSESIISLDLTRDEWTPVINQITERYSRQNTLPTGFSVLDNDILNGGFEKARLYLFGGTTGAGKSTLLINFIINAITCAIVQIEEEIKKNVYVYITLENTIDESLLRLYCALFSRTSIEVLKEIASKRDIKKPVTNILEKNNSIIIMKYFPAGSIGPNDLQVIVDEVYEEYGKDSIKGFYLDYLDNLKIDKTSEMRHELNSITLSLKTLAIENNFPLVTLTQLNRNAYNFSQTGGHDLNLSQMSESMGKAHTSDFVGLMTRDSLDESVVHLKIGKNRSGRSNMSVDFKVDFSRFKFLNAYKVTRDRTQESGIGADSEVVHTFLDSVPDSGDTFGF